MTGNIEAHPTEQDADEIARSVMGYRHPVVRRFATGVGHWVYEVRGADGSASVVRMGRASQSDDFTGAAHWSQTLRPLGVPLPELLAHGKHRDLPYMILSLLPGRELGSVYSTLTQRERRAIVEAVCEIEWLVGTLPSGTGYGYVRSPETPTLATWRDVVEASLARSRTRIRVAGLVSLRCADLVSERVHRLSGYFTSIRATPFLDDLTTKNVLVDSGRFAGIVDVDWVCYGDSLFTIALTRTSLLSMGADPDYVDHWCSIRKLTRDELRAVYFYTALFCVDFLGEFGQAFNGNIETATPERVARIEQLAKENLSAAQ